VTRDQRLVVIHERLGTRVESLIRKPQAQARDMGRAILAGEVSVPDVDTVDDFGVGTPSDS
jgi:hypothetical protein